jgi:hypothetical protein|tara:strand:+ start:811 stop:1329 length:519 start_codon:yes stop_codon:yes gene_type:complete
MQLKPVSSNLIQNMSCRPRTTVNSRGMDKKILPSNLTGTVTNISLNNFHNDPRIIKDEDPVPLIYAMIQLGVDKEYLDYREFIKGCEDSHKKLLILIEKPSREVIKYGLPSIGLAYQFTDKSWRDFGKKPSILTAVFIMARCGDSVFIRDKNPLLSRLSFNRETAVMFLGGQ